MFVYNFGDFIACYTIIVKINIANFKLVTKEHWESFKTFFFNYDYPYVEKFMIRLNLKTIVCYEYGKERDVSLI